MRLLSCVAIRTALLAGAISAACLAQSLYSVSVDTTQLRGSAGKLVFDITSNYPLTNRVDVINFTTDGTTGLPETQGDLVTGDLIQGSNPARITRIKANGFYTELALPFTAFGDIISFGLNASETGPSGDRPPDKFSVYVLGADGRVLGGTRSARDGAPNLSITITGARGGVLETAKAERAAALNEQFDDQEAAVTRSTVRFNVTSDSTADDPALLQNSQIYEGDLTEYCNRRCKGEKACTGGAFAIAIKDDSFYAFDDVGNLKAQVAIVESGQNPLVEGQWGHVKVVGILKDSVLTVREISFF